ncbi:hypothetical protein CTA2_1160 [Colletotrichum tanaceti]|nr:hypothetical protein CTA2_1160 [Colletotrichum tanaceti]
MLGYGAMPPGSPEPYFGRSSLPILCLLQRGRPMVAIFFAISGYVLCRHILRAIHERRLEAAYQGLASSVFRRVFRLYIPPTLSMFLVALLAQMGAFRPEDDIFKGPDSRYINGTVTLADVVAGTQCPNGTYAVDGAPRVADFLGLRTPAYLGNLTTNETSALCLRPTSQLFMPAMLYMLADEFEAKEAAIRAKEEQDEMLINVTMEDAITVEAGDKAKVKVKDKAKAKAEKPKSSYRDLLHLRSKLPVAPSDDDDTNDNNDDNDNDNDTNGRDKARPRPTNFKWVQLGGSWEEHPLIHDNMTYALKNFTRVYVEWANPFNFGHYHPRYDPHTFTIPMELRGSMFIYLFLLATAALTARWRFRIGALLSAYSLVLGRWDMAIFMGGVLLSEADIRRADSHGGGSGAGVGAGGGGGGEGALVPPVTSSSSIKSRHRAGGLSQSVLGSRTTRWATLVVALYLLSYPDAGAEWTPGFVFLSSLVPRYYIPLSGWMFYQAAGALLLLPCVLHSPTLRGALEGRAAQHLGRVSFSFYLLHGPVLHSLGFWIMPRLFDRLGHNAGFLVGWAFLLAVSLYLSDWWCRKVDVWSVTVGRRVEKMMKD